jgi:hypothetical protein
MFSNDSLFCVLSACKSSCSISRLTNIVYIYQLLKFNINFKFKLPFCNLESLELGRFVSEQISMGYLEETSSGFNLTILGEELLNGFVGSKTEFEYCDKVNSVCADLDNDALSFICLANYIITEVKEKFGVIGLIEQKDKITATLKRLSAKYTDANFNEALSIIRNLKELKL